MINAKQVYLEGLQSRQEAISKAISSLKYNPEDAVKDNIKDLTATLNSMSHELHTEITKVTSEIMEEESKVKDLPEVSEY